MDEPVYRELVWVFFASFEFDSIPCRLTSTRSGLRGGETVKAEHVLMRFWSSLGDGKFVVGGMAVKKVRDPRVRLAHCCIMTTISGRRESTQRITDLICGGMFVTRIARSLGLLTNAMVDALCVEPRAHVFNKRSLISIRVVMDLGGGTCCWPATRQVGEEDEVEEAAEEGAGGSANVYRNMSQGDWQGLSIRALEWTKQMGWWWWGTGGDLDD
ncbi:hypothetical protein Tco_1355229 [Tanacetum coccineum]